MSDSLVKRSLELFDDDLNVDKDKLKKKKKTEQEDPMSLISTNRKGVKKGLKKLQQSRKKKSSGKKSAWSAIEKYNYDQSCDYTEASVKALQRISQTFKKDNSTAHVVLNHNHSRRPYSKESSKTSVDTESTVFTDEDFKKFAEEYFS